jgi:hypothetical protein
VAYDSKFCELSLFFTVDTFYCLDLTESSAELSLLISNYSSWIILVLNSESSSLYVRNREICDYLLDFVVVEIVFGIDFELRSYSLYTLCAREEDVFVTDPLEIN